MPDGLYPKAGREYACDFGTGTVFDGNLPSGPVVPRVERRGGWSVRDAEAREADRERARREDALRKKFGGTLPWVSVDGRWRVEFNGTDMVVSADL